MTTKVNKPIVWKPQSGPQEAFCRAGEFEVFYGGAAGGGKSDALLMEGARYIDQPDYRAILFRRTTPQLEYLIERSKALFPRLGGQYIDQPKSVWRFPSGARFFFGHMERDKDKTNYDGKPYHFIGFDELTHFLYTQYIYMLSRCRTVNPAIPPRVRASGMPFGAGILWVKDRFITIGPNKTYRDSVSGLTRRFIPANLDDNKILMDVDGKGYDGRLKLMGTRLYNALRFGDWDVIEGACFEELDKRVHMLKPHMPPQGTPIYRALDWGYAKPFSIGWYYENNDGALVRFLEWYGCTDQPDKGLRMESRDVARGILDFERENDIQVSYGVADPSIWAKDDENSIAENMRDEGVVWEPATNDRLQGKMEFHTRLQGETHNGQCEPWLFVTSNCKHWWRTVPALQSTEKKPEDVDTTMEDHVYDETRYMLMDRPCMRGSGEIFLGNDRATANMP